MRLGLGGSAYGEDQYSARRINRVKRINLQSGGSVWGQEDQCMVCWRDQNPPLTMCRGCVQLYLPHSCPSVQRLTVSSCVYHSHVPLYIDWLCPVVFATLMSLRTETDSVQLYLPHSCPSVQRLCPVYHTHGPLYRGWLCPVVFGNWAWYSVDNYLRLLWVWVSNPTAVANIRVWESFFFGWRGFQTTLESPKYDHHRNQWK